MSTDPFTATSDSLIAPARIALAIVPSDTTALPMHTKAIYIGTGGDIVLRTVGSSSDVTFRNVAAGSVLALRVSAIRATGTTAEDLVGLA